MTEKLSEVIGRRIRIRREELGLSREKLAENAELSSQFIADIEMGRKSMTTNSLYKIVPALNITADYLLFGINAIPNASKIDNLLASLSKSNLELAENILQNFVEAVKR